MRRKDREVTDAAQIREIIAACRCCRVGFCENGGIYIVPLNFGFCCEDGQYTFYFHSAKEGRKIGLLREKPSVGFEMDTGYVLHTADTACGHSAAYQSIIGTGTAEIVTDAAEKRKGLSLLMLHETGRKDWDYPAADTVTVFKITVHELSCKARIGGGVLS